MKRIHFDHKIDWLMLAIIVVAVGLYTISFHNWLDLEEGQQKFLFLLGGLLNVIVLTRIFWYKYYVRWNSKAITLKFNSFSGHTIPFDNIERFDFSDSELVIHKLKSNKKIVISTSGIAEEDWQRLESILTRHTKILKV